jgi:hypothetical protein
MQHLYRAFPGVDTIENAKRGVKQTPYTRIVFDWSAHGRKRSEQVDVIEKSVDESFS